MSCSAILDRIDRINNAPTFQRACAAFEQEITTLGIQYYAAGPVGAEPSNDVFAVAEAPRHWMTYYTERGMVEHDPLLRCAREGRTFLWTDVQPQDEAEANVLHEMRTLSGMREGFVTVTPGPGALKGGVSIAGSGVATWSARERLEARILGQALMERAFFLNSLQEKPRIRVLSRAEKKMLMYASNGCVDKEIAQHLGVAPGRVHERWKSIRRKLDAKDRASAVAIAVALGLVPPPSRAMTILGGGGNLG